MVKPYMNFRKNSNIWQEKQERGYFKKFCAINILENKKEFTLIHINSYIKCDIIKIKNTSLKKSYRVFYSSFFIYLKGVIVWVEDFRVCVMLTQKATLMKK